MSDIEKAYKKFVDTIREGVNNTKTATVEKVSGNKVDVKLDDGRMIPNVPIFNFGVSSSVGLFFPIAKGQTGSIVVFDHNIDAFLNNAKKNSEDHIHELEDCFYIPGFLINSERPANPDNVVLKNGTMSIEISDGKIKISGGTKEVLTLISNFMDNAILTLNQTINDTLVVNVGAATGVHSPALITAWSVPATGLKALLERSKNDLDGLIL